MHLHKFLGIELIDQDEDGVTLELPLRDEFRNSDGYLHGGITAVMADAALGVALQLRLGPEGRATTVEMKLNYLRPVHGGKLTARSKFVKLGKTLCVGQVDVHDGEDRHVAVALMTYMVLDGGGPR